MNLLTSEAATCTNCRITSENGWVKKGTFQGFQGNHLSKCMKMYECLNYTLHKNTSISIQSCCHLSPLPPKADAHCLVFKQRHFGENIMFILMSYATLTCLFFSVI